MLGENYLCNSLQRRTCRWHTINFRSGWCRWRAVLSRKRILNARIAHVREAAKRGAQVICLPELFLTQYFCQREDLALFDLAEPIPGPTTARFCDLCRELRVTAVVSLFERRAPGLYHNTAAVIGRGRHVARHLSQDAHPRRSALFREILLRARRSRLQSV